jgi:hypothetical protein
MSENELRAELRAMGSCLQRIETKQEALEAQIHAMNLNLVDRVVRLETQMKIAVGLLGLGGVGAAGFFGIGG